MKFSLMKGRDVIENSINILSQQLANIRYALVSVSNVVRVDLSSLSNDDPRAVPMEVLCGEHDRDEQLFRYGGNKTFYEMVRKIASGELFPIDRPIYNDREEHNQARVDFLSLLLFNVDCGDNGIYLSTIEGRKLLGLTTDNPLIKRDGSDASCIWNFRFNKDEPDEINGFYQAVLRNKEYISSLGFGGFGCSSKTKYVYATTSEFNGFATLELGHPSVLLGNVDSRYIDPQAVNDVILGDYRTPTQDEIMSAAVDVLERFRLWMCSADRAACERAKEIFNTQTDTTLISVEGFIEKIREGEEGEEKTPAEAYRYRIATIKNLEHYTQRHIGYGDDDIKVYGQPFNETVKHDFLLPLLGKTEEHPEFHKVNRAFHTTNLIKLISGLQDFLKDPETYLAVIRTDRY